MESNQERLIQALADVAAQHCRTTIKCRWCEFRNVCPPNANEVSAWDSAIRTLTVQNTVSPEEKNDEE